MRKFEHSSFEHSFYQNMKQFRNPVYISIIIGITLAFVFALSTNAQKYQRTGNTFVELSDSSKKQKSEPQKTVYTYVKNGVSYPVYVSKNGKYFIIRTSKKTGKPYRQYLPKVTEELNK